MFGQRSRGVLALAVLAAVSSHAAFAAELRPGKEPEWKRQMRQKLRKEVACGFRKTRLRTALSALQRQTDLHLTVSTRALGRADAKRVEHKAVKDTLAFALRSLLERAGLDYELRPDGVYISTAEEIGERGEIAREPYWEFEIRKKFEGKVSFEFVDTPLSECVQFLQTLTKINMILDPGGLKRHGNPPITLKLINEPLRDAFDRVLEIARFDYALIDEAIFISTRERLVREFERQAAVARAEAASGGRKEPAWKQGMRRRLERKVTFEFIDTPIQEALQFLQVLTKTTFILDPKAVEGRDLTPITLRVNNMSLGLALRWMVRLAGLDYTIKDRAVWMTTPENVVAELRRRAKREAEEGRPEWEQAFRRKLLRRRVSFEFVDTPLSEAIQFLQTLCKCSMILDPRAVELRGNTPINLKVSDMPLELALDWIMRLADLEYAFKDGAIFISTPEIIARERKAGLIPGSPSKTPPVEEDVF